MTAPSDTALRRNVLSSIKTAQEIVAHLERSLSQGGFDQAIDSYQEMSRVLLAQRLWADGNEGLVREFAALGKGAARVHQILLPYVNMMRALSCIVDVNQDAAAPNPDPVSRRSDEDELVSCLKRLGPGTQTELARELGIDRSSLRAKLEGLTEAGEVRSRAVRGTKLFYLT